MFPRENFWMYADVVDDSLYRAVGEDNVLSAVRGGIVYVMSLSGDKWTSFPERLVGRFLRLRKDSFPECQEACRYDFVQTQVRHGRNNIL